jgi:hypothetical protein
MYRGPVTIALALAGARADGQVTTAQYDNARTGANLRETRLTPPAVGGLYSSDGNGVGDRAFAALRLSIPTVAEGRVYVTAKGAVNVYGLRTPK